MSKNISKKVLAQLALVLGFTSFSLSADATNFEECKTEAKTAFVCKKYGDFIDYLQEDVSSIDLFLLDALGASNLVDTTAVLAKAKTLSGEISNTSLAGNTIKSGDELYLPVVKLSTVKLNFAAHSARIQGGLNIEFSKGMCGGGLDVVVGGNLPQSFGLVTKKDKSQQNNAGSGQTTQNAGNKSSEPSKENLLLMKEKLHITLRPYLVVYIKDFFARLGYTCNLSFFEADKKEHRVKEYDDNTKKSSGFMHAHGFNFGLGYSFTKNVALVGILDVTFNMKAKDKSAQQAQSGSKQSQQNQNQKDSKDKLSASGMNIAFTVNLIGRFAHSSGLKVGAMVGAGYGYQSFKFESLADLVEFRDVVSRINDQQGKQKGGSK